MLICITWAISASWGLLGLLLSFMPETMQNAPTLLGGPWEGRQSSALPLHLHEYPAPAAEGVPAISPV